MKSLLLKTTAAAVVGTVMMTSAQAMPMAAPQDASVEAPLTLVSGGCGPYAHRAPTAGAGRVVAGVLAGAGTVVDGTAVGIMDGVAAGTAGNNAAGGRVQRRHS